MKNNQKGFVIPLIIIIIALLAIGGGVFVYENKKAEAPAIENNNLATTTATTTPIVGGDKDEHGCIGSAGYSWCALKNKCLRIWEEKCEAVSSCSPNWKCGWGTCTNGYQGMTAVDSNNCGLSSAGVQIACPALARECSN